MVKKSESRGPLHFCCQIYFQNSREFFKYLEQEWAWLLRTLPTSFTLQRQTGWRLIASSPNICKYSPPHPKKWRRGECIFPWQIASLAFTQLQTFWQNTLSSQLMDHRLYAGSAWNYSQSFLLKSQKLKLATCQVPNQIHTIWSGQVVMIITLVGGWEGPVGGVQGSVPRRPSVRAAPAVWISSWWVGHKSNYLFEVGWWCGYVIIFQRWWRWRRRWQW